MRLTLSIEKEGELMIRTKNSDIILICKRMVFSNSKDTDERYLVIIKIQKRGI